MESPRIGFQVSEVSASMGRQQFKLQVHWLVWLVGWYIENKNGTIIEWYFIQYLAQAYSSCTFNGPIALWLRKPWFLSQHQYWFSNKERIVCLNCYQVFVRYNTFPNPSSIEFNNWSTICTYSHIIYYVVPCWLRREQFGVSSSTWLFFLVGYYLLWTCKASHSVSGFGNYVSSQVYNRWGTLAMTLTSFIIFRTMLFPVP